LERKDGYIHITSIAVLFAPSPFWHLLLMAALYLDTPFLLPNVLFAYSLHTLFFAGLKFD
jgi:hypothetical protein